MTAHVALLRAVNVGGTGRLRMQDLKRLCEEVGFGRVETYIASGNVVFECGGPEEAIRSRLETRLAAHMGAPVGVLVRSAAEMAEVLAANPFPDRPPSRTVAIFLHGTPPPDTLERITGRNGEEIGLGRREIYVHYGQGMARSKLAIPAARSGTARNMNTVARLADMAARL